MTPIRSLYFDWFDDISACYVPDLATSFQTKLHSSAHAINTVLLHTSGSHTGGHGVAVTHSHAGACSRAPIGINYYGALALSMMFETPTQAHLRARRTARRFPSASRTPLVVCSPWGIKLFSVTSEGKQGFSGEIR